MNRLVVLAWHYIPGIHPRMDYLIAHSEGQASRDVERHLSSCQRCSNIARLICTAVESAHQTHLYGKDRTIKLLRETYEVLQLRMKTHQDQRSKLRTALELYFGKKIAQHIGYDKNGCLLLSHTQSFFVAFLGKKAAAVLAQEVISAVT